MGKKHKSSRKEKKARKALDSLAAANGETRDVPAAAATGVPDAAPSARERMKGSDYEKELEKLQVQLCYLQAWLKTTGHRCIVVLEGRDAAGKGGMIKALTARVSPRVFRVVALPAPSDREKTQMLI